MMVYISSDQGDDNTVAFISSATKYTFLPSTKLLLTILFVINICHPIESDIIVYNKL